MTLPSTLIHKCLFCLGDTIDFGLFHLDWRCFRIKAVPFSESLQWESKSCTRQEQTVLWALTLNHVFLPLTPLGFNRPQNRLKQLVVKCCLEPTQLNKWLLWNSELTLTPNPRAIVFLVWISPSKDTIQKLFLHNIRRVNFLVMNCHGNLTLIHFPQSFIQI